MDAPAGPKKRWVRPVDFFIPLYLVGNVLSLCIGTALLRAQFELVAGWAIFLVEVLPRVRPNPAAIGLGALCLVLATAGVHSFAGWFRSARRPEATPWRLKWTISLVGLFVLAFTAGIAFVGVAHQTAWLATAPEPLIASDSVHGPETAAIGALKTIAISESIFREGDKDQNGALDYGTLDQLAQAQLVDDVLGSGTKLGYVFVVGPSPITSEFLWFATASPVHPIKNQRWFFINQTAVIHYTTEGPLQVDRGTCDVPWNAVPVGK
jgi:hypothetical protein